MLSLGDVLSTSDLGFLLQVYKPVMTKPDVSGSTGLHYAAEYDVDVAFQKLRVQDQCSLYTPRESDGECALSLLIMRQRTDILRSEMVERLGIDPFRDSFNWLHIAISMGSTKVVLYLFREHRRGLEQSLLHPPTEETDTPFDVLLETTELSKAQRNLYIDGVLSLFKGGLRLKSHSPEQVLRNCYGGQLSASMNALQIIRKCASDCIGYK